VEIDSDNLTAEQVVAEVMRLLETAGVRGDE